MVAINITYRYIYSMLKFCVRNITRLLLSLRYTWTIKGLDNLEAKKGICFFANHPSELDPVILMALLGERYSPRPIVVETVYEMPFISLLMKFVHAIPMPDFDLGGNDYTLLLAKRVLDRIVRILGRGGNILLYPSGHLKSSGFEKVRGVSGAFDIITKSKEAHIVLVRTEGLWGSLFSLARTQSSSEIFWALLKSLGILLKNGIFFAPRRHITIEFFDAPPDFYTYSSKEGFNRALEEWFNKPYGKEGEPLSLVRESFWSDKLPEPLVRKTAAIPQDVALPEDVVKKVFAEIAYIAKKKPAELALEQTLNSDVGLDSLDVITLIAFLENEFSIKHLVPSDLYTVFDACYLASNKLAPKGGELAHTRGWPSFEKRMRPAIAEGQTIIEVFLRNCEKHIQEPACADLITGRILSYKKARLSVIVLSHVFRKFPEKKVAVMLPATATAYLVVLALMLSGKTPVMLNWTLGSFFLREAMKSGGASRIITSKKFVRFAKTMDLEGLDDKLFFLEEMDLSLWTKFQGWIDSKRLIDNLLPSITDESHAVILFTSGSESTPKAVPLTHKNILSNQRAACSVVSFHKEDVLLGFLPPFHSFGFGVTGLLPLLSGLLVVYAPDPTDSFRLVQSLDPWKITFLCGAPTFLRALLHSIDADQGRESVRLVVTGAEKAPEALFAGVAEKLPRAQLLEGYGITECSPILTLNLPGRAVAGVGLPLPTVELAVSDLNVEQLLPTGKTGIILARGPGIFHGYLSQSVSRPFVTLEGKKWYVTGDLGYLDADGALWLSGRLKRFVKIGGEMINLLSIEEALVEGLGSFDSPYIAVLPLEIEGERPRLYLFTTKPISLEEANHVLRQKKLSHLVKLFDVIHIEEMPLLGTGKVNIRSLEEKLRQIK